MPSKLPKRRRKSPLTAKSVGPSSVGLALPVDVAGIRDELRAFLRTKDRKGRPIGSSRFGIYAFYDYDSEPIYVGQTYEGLSARIGRHLTNQRTDAVAMNVLDPFEVAEVRVWPLDLEGLPERERGKYLDRAEYTVYRQLLEESKLGAVLNERPPKPTEILKLPQDYRGPIIPQPLYPHRKHPDIRIARRASTIANLARVISERKVSRGLRRTLLTQARRLERLAAERLKDFPAGAADESESE